MEHRDKIIAVATLLGWTPLATALAGGMWFAPDEKHKLLERSHRLPLFFTDANAAIGITDHMAKRGWRCKLNRGTGNGWECVFFKAATKDTHPDNLRIELMGERFEDHYGCGDSFPEAVCMAFLKLHKIHA